VFFGKSEKADALDGADQPDLLQQIGRSAVNMLTHKRALGLGAAT
jgi:hypothetical protein